MNFCHLMILLLASPEEVAEYEVDEAVAEDEQGGDSSKICYKIVTIM